MIMHRNSPYSIKAMALCLAVALLSACSNSGTPDPVEDSGVGAIQGFVNLHDAFGVPLRNDSMLVSITGTGFTSLSAIDGDYVFTRVPLGTYELVFEKEGYGTFKRQVEHERSFERGNTTLLDLFLGQISSTQVTGGRNPEFDGNDLRIGISTLPSGSATNPVYISAFLGKEESVSNEVNIGVVGPIRYIDGTASVDMRVTAAQLAAFGFQSGETIHYKIYGDSFQTNAYDGENGKIHPNANTSGAFVSGSIIMP